MNWGGLFTDQVSADLAIGVFGQMLDAPRNSPVLWVLGKEAKACLVRTWQRPVKTLNSPRGVERCLAIRARFFVSGAEARLELLLRDIPELGRRVSVREILAQRPAAVPFDERL